MDTSVSSTAATSTLAPAPGELRPRAERLPELCQTGVILRSLLFVQVVVGTGAAFGSPTLASWCLRSAVAAAVAVPATLGWLIAACSATPLLAKLPKPARVALVAAAAGFAAWAACLPLHALQLVAGEPAGAAGVVAVVCAGALMGAVVYHWLELRVRATLPAATEARLVELQARVRPHFLFNTLNTAIALVRVDPARAETVMEDLSDLFRAALGAMEGDSTLGEEIRLARMYLDIEGMRFGRRLAVEWDVDEAVNPARVPPLLLQPLVENAVRHGVEPNDGPGRVQVRARVRNGRAWVQVVNTVGAPAAPGHGIGLASARERLRLMHDIHAEFQSGPIEGGRFRVRLAVPLE